jgi:hypothetical protein
VQTCALPSRYSRHRLLSPRSSQEITAYVVATATSWQRASARVAWEGPFLLFSQSHSTATSGTCERGSGVRSTRDLRMCGPSFPHCDDAALDSGNMSSCILDVRVCSFVRPQPMAIVSMWSEQKGVRVCASLLRLCFGHGFPLTPFHALFLTLALLLFLTNNMNVTTATRLS